MMAELWVNELWLAGTAVIFTVVGYFWGKRYETESIVASTIDYLIEDGYLKTHGAGKNIQILKWSEWNNKDDPTITE